MSPDELVPEFEFHVVTVVRAPVTHNHFHRILHFLSPPGVSQMSRGGWKSLRAAGAHYIKHSHFHS